MTDCAIRNPGDGFNPSRSNPKSAKRTANSGKRITELAGAGVVCTACGALFQHADDLKPHREVCPGKRRKAR